ncbi:MAG TPA: cation transporter [Terriglobales bacterium]|jgi:divalent metal cation (Fe/Co/Zn/Cd) transporter|nr:cation transporter [Terriglobales bacterium]
MSITTVLPVPDLARRVQRLQFLTVVWMTGEAIVAIVAAWRARSPALAGFGGDSVIELLSAMVVLWRFRSQSESGRAERIAARTAGALLFVVAGIIVIFSILTFLGYGEPRPSYIGFVLLIVAAFGMPWLASQKRRLAAQLSSASLKADAAESSLCGYMSWIALGGLVANAVLENHGQTRSRPSFLSRSS